MNDLYYIHFNFIKLHSLYILHFLFSVSNAFSWSASQPCTVLVGENDQISAAKSTISDTNRSPATSSSSRSKPSTQSTSAVASPSSASTSNDVQTSDASSDSHEGGKMFDKITNSRKRRHVDIFDMDAFVADNDGALENPPSDFSYDTTNFVTSNYKSSSPSISNMHEFSYSSSPINGFIYNLPNSSPFSVILPSSSSLSNDNYIHVTDDAENDNVLDKIISHSNNIIDDDNTNNDDNDEEGGEGEDRGGGNSQTQNSDKFLTSTTNRSFDGDIIFVNDVNRVAFEVPDVTNMNVDEFVTSNHNTNNNNEMVNDVSYNNNKSNLKDDEGNGDGEGYRVNDEVGSGMDDDTNMSDENGEKNKNDKSSSPIKYYKFPSSQTYTNEKSFNEKLNGKIMFDNNKNSLLLNDDEHREDDDDNNQIQNDFPLIPQPEFINYGQDNVDIVKLDSDLNRANDDVEKTKTVYNNIIENEHIEIHQLDRMENEITNEYEYNKNMPKYYLNDTKIEVNKEIEKPSSPLPSLSSDNSAVDALATNNDNGPNRLLLNLTIGTDSGIGTARNQIYVLQIAVPGGPNLNLHPQTVTHYDTHDSLNSHNSLNCPPVPPPAPPCPCSCLDDVADNNNDKNFISKLDNIELRTNIDTIVDDNNIHNDKSSKYLKENVIAKEAIVVVPVETATSSSSASSTTATTNDGVFGDGIKNEENNGDIVSTTTEWMIDRSGSMIEVNEKLCPDATPILILEGEIVMLR